MNKATIVWKTKEEIEREKNAPKPPTTEERIQALEMAMLEMILGGAGNGAVSGDPNPTGTDND